MGAKTIFAQNVRRVRRRLGLTQEALADKAAVGRSYLSDLECARRSPSIEMIARLASALGVTASVLVEGIPDQKVDKPS
jgi:transcriptional regulator with XRE-family HTH domain